MPDDILWFVTYEDEILYLVGRMEVARIVGQHEAEQYLHSTELWEATYHAGETWYCVTGNIYQPHGSRSSTAL